MCDSLITAQSIMAKYLQGHLHQSRSALGHRQWLIEFSCSPELLENLMLPRLMLCCNQSSAYNLLHCSQTCVEAADNPLRFWRLDVLMAGGVAHVKGLEQRGRLRCEFQHQCSPPQLARNESSISTPQP